MKTTDSRVAIIGMACEYPDASTPKELWENALAKRRAFRKIPPERLAPPYWEENSNADAVASKYAAVLEGWEFDRQHFRIPEETYRSSDPVHWLALDVAERVVKRSGLEELDPVNTRVVVGNTLTGDATRAESLRLRWPFVEALVSRELDRRGIPLEEEFLDPLESRFRANFTETTGETLAGALSNTIAGRICNYFNFQAGGYTVDGACASSLLALIDAARALFTGEADFVLAGGVDLSLDPFELAGFSRAGAIATDYMRVFDERSCGFWPGEGCGFVVMTRPAVAERHELDPLAYLDGWGVSSDGAGGGITRPDAEGQTNAITRAIDAAEADARRIAYVEAHGTGTPVGDSAELTALHSSYGPKRSESPLFVGSVKAQIGHTKAAAGMAGLIKSVRAVDEGVIPPLISCERPVEPLAESESPLEFAQYPKDWPSSGRRTAAVSSMGFGGINTHVILTSTDVEADTNSQVHATDKYQRAPQDAEIFFFGGRREEIVRELQHVGHQAQKLSESDITDLAATLAARGARGPRRAAFVASTPGEVTESTEDLLAYFRSDGEEDFSDRTNVYVGNAERHPSVGLMFPGQGAPPGRNAEKWRARFGDREDPFLEIDPADRDTLDTKNQQPIVVDRALAGLTLLDEFGLDADAAVGHSLGELLALHWASSLGEKPLRSLAEKRGRIISEHGRDEGTMLAVRANAERVRQLASETPATIAVVNGPSQVVVSGPEQAVDHVEVHCEEQDLSTARLRVSHAFHSPLMEAVRSPFEQMLGDYRFEEPEKPVYSTISGDRIPKTEDLTRQLVRQLTKPVRFSEAVSRLASDVDVLLEVGPGRILSDTVREYLSTPVQPLQIGGDGFSPFLRAVALTYCFGCDIDIQELFADRFTRPLRIDRSPAFIANPCDQTIARLSGDGGGKGNQHGKRVSSSSPKREVAGQDAEVGSKDDDASGPTSEEAASVLREAVAETMTLDPSDVDLDANLQRDLNLSSLQVAKIVAQASSRLGVSPPGDPTSFVDSDLRAVGEVLSDLGVSGSVDGTDGTTGGVEGIERWVRSFEVNPCDAEPTGVPLSSGSGARSTWTIFRTEKTDFEAKLREILAKHCPVNGIAAVAPGTDYESEAHDIFRAVRTAVASSSIGSCLLVHRGERWGGGAMRSLVLEESGLDVAVVSVPALTPEWVEPVAEEMKAADGFVEVGYTAEGVRQRPQFTPARSLEDGGSIPLRKGDVVLVSGGGKGIGFECSLALAQNAEVHLVPFGRSSPEGDSDLAENLGLLESEALAVDYSQTDVTDPKQVRTLANRVRGEHGPLAGLIHAAGVNRPGRIQEKELSDLDRTLAPKVQGLRNLLDALSEDEVKLLITFGSVIAHTGFHGQAEYALANGALAAITQSYARDHPGALCAALEWSVWAGTGMAEDLGVLEQMRRRGVQPISQKAGRESFVETIKRGTQRGRLIVTGRLPWLEKSSRDGTSVPFERFLEVVQVHYPSVELICEAELSARDDRYLEDHKVDDIPMLPAVFSMEASVQVATALSPDEKPYHLEELQFQQPITIPSSETERIRIASLRHDDGAVDISIRSESTDYDEVHVWARCVPEASLESGDWDEFAKPPNPFEPSPLGTEDVVRDALYGQLLFHGPRFQSIDHFERVDPDCCRVVVAANTREEWFGRHQPGRLRLGNPAVRDGAIHALQACLPTRRVLPKSVGAVSRRKTLGDSDEAFRIRARETFREDDSFTYDLQIETLDGEPVEVWKDLALEGVDAQEYPAALPAPLLRVGLGRRLQSLLERRDVWIRLFDGPDRDLREIVGSVQDCVLVGRHADGEPHVEGPWEVSVSHGSQETLVACSRSSVSCDVERLTDREDESPPLPASDHTLRTRLAEQLDETEATAALRLWTCRESLKKIAGDWGHGLHLEKARRDVGATLVAGRYEVASSVTTLGSEGQEFAIALAMEEDDAL